MLHAYSKNSNSRRKKLFVTVHGLTKKNYNAKGKKKKNLFIANLKLNDAMEISD